MRITQEALEQELNKSKDDLENLGTKIQVAKVATAQESIGNYIEAGSKYAVVFSDKDIKVYLPEKEHSAYHNTFKKKMTYKFLKVTVLEKIDNIYIVSAREYTRLKNQPILEELKAANFVKARVIGFSEFSAILDYKGLQLELTNKDFSSRGTVSVSDVFRPNDVIPVVFDRVKKNGRVIKVKALSPYPKPEYLDIKSISDFEIGEVYLGKIIKTTPTAISVMLAYDSAAPKDDQGRPTGFERMIVLTAQHPEPILDEYMIKNLPVEVLITKPAEPLFRGKILSYKGPATDDGKLIFMKRLIQGAANDSNN